MSKERKNSEKIDLFDQIEDLDLQIDGCIAALSGLGQSYADSDTLKDSVLFLRDSLQKSHEKKQKLIDRLQPNYQGTN